MKARDFRGKTLQLENKREKKQLCENIPSHDVSRWVARRDHLHAGLSEAARRHGVDLIVSSRVCHMDDSGEKVILETDRGIKYTFDFVIGADGIKSFVRQKIFPDVVPKAPSKVAAYRGVLAYDKIFADFPEARTFLGNTMDVWIGPNGYILTYPISGGKELNVVTAFCKDDYVTQMEHVDVDEFRSYYKDYSPVIQGLLKMVNYTQRWPLLQMPPLKAWSNERKNVVLLGDAVHCMQNHMAQGAATAIEDGAFLGRVVSEVVRGTITIADAVSLYEKSRIPKAWVKQQISFVSGDVNMAVDRIEQRTQATSPEILAFHQNPVRPEPLPPMYRSWQFYSNPESVPGIFYYDAEGDADSAVCEYLCSKGQVNESEMLSLNLKDKWWGYMVDNGFRKRADLAIHKGLSEEDYRKYGKGL
jgi:salicylate hydroxylase